jgi:hypothetical protein
MGKGSRNMSDIFEKFRSFDGSLDETSFICTPFHIDFPNQMKIGKRVFANHSLTCQGILYR